MTILSDHTISLATLTFHYREAGDVAAPPLILLHALGTNAQDWDEVALALAERYHVFALDQRGHGESARPGISSLYTFEAMRFDLKVFVDTLRLDRITLIGHSMGGTVAFLFAELYPDRIERLVIEDTPPPRGNSDLPEPPDDPDVPVPFDWQLLKPIVRQLNNPDPSWWNNLPTITVPTLLIGGGSTSHIPQEELAEVARLIPNCRLITIEGAGHAVHQNRSSEYIEIVKEFLFK